MTFSRGQVYKPAIVPLAGGTKISNGDGPSIVLAVVVLVLAQVMAMGVYASRYKRVPPNQALVIYGRKMRPGLGDEGFRVLVGGGKFVMPIIETSSFLSLAPFVVEVDAGTRGAFKLLLTAKISRDPEGVRRAARNLLDRPGEEIHTITAAILEGNARRVLGRGTPPEDPAFAEEVEAATRSDYDLIGLEVVGRLVVRSR